jgi:ligand-binding SRPBCC domain-containing protein
MELHWLNRQRSGLCLSLSTYTWSVGFFKSFVCGTAIIVFIEIGTVQLWHRPHCFEAREGRTKMIDVVRYRLPLGVLGRRVHALKVRGDVRRIFDYRRQRIHESFTEQRKAET